MSIETVLLMPPIGVRFSISAVPIRPARKTMKSAPSGSAGSFTESVMPFAT